MLILNFRPIFLYLKGFYGIASLSTSDSLITLERFVNINLAYDYSIHELNLSYAYYLTFDGVEEWNPRIEVLTRSNDEVSAESLIGSITRLNMTGNKWETANATFNANFNNYSVRNFC